MKAREEQPVIKIVVVDDHAVVRGGLSKFLLVYPDLELVGEAESGTEAVHLCATLQPDVVLMDLKMPDMDGVAATRQILQQWNGGKGSRRRGQLAEKTPRIRKQRCRSICIGSSRYRDAPCLSATQPATIFYSSTGI